ncbi:hypothetical protein F0U62_08585 [Cystobacter fuscus]|uniref:hypothetical protein n=1 Tax=Cystobacter fuscus TaxID=43 RepID=UPI002B2D6C0C|nr:hypothetical protein F0U62_08585 [Cystobacter fuscus]
MRFPYWSMALSFFLPLSVLANEDPLAELLPRLAAAEQAREQRRQGRTTLATTVWEELDDEGKTKSRLESVERNEWRGGKRASSVVRATQDGQDVTEKVREQRVKEEKARAESKEKQFQLDYLPFSAREQGRYRFEVKGPDSRRPNLLRIAFAPKEGSKCPDGLVGEALVDGSRGELLRISTRPTQLPKLADKVDITLEFDAPGAQGRELTRILATGEGGVLFIRRRVRSTTTFSYAP